MFTDRPFGGNPLAVFPEAEGLSDAEMQAIAREMNLSETTFVLPPTDPKADVRVRIFTPAAELPFAGHPVLGTHFVLAQTGRYRLQAPVTRVWGQLGLGTLPVDLHVAGGEVTRVVMTQAQPQFLAILPNVAPLADALGLAPQEIEDTGLPVQLVSTGLPQLMVPLRSLAAIRQIALNVADLNTICRQIGTDCVMVFTHETLFPANQVHTRMFAPLLGVLEDPATGSASGALGAYLVHHRAVPLGEPTTFITSEQGYEIERPSTLFIEVDREGEAITAVRVGGQVVTVIEGILRV